MMRDRLNHWFIVAHSTFPMTVKFVARGAIAGGIAGFVLSFVYSILFGLPFAFGAIIFSIFKESVWWGVMMSLPIVLTVIALLIIQCVLPASVIGMAGGALTGLGVKLINQTPRQCPMQVELFSLLFWIPVTILMATMVLPKIILGISIDVDDFRQWLFVFIPSAIFVAAMVWVARISLFPFINMFTKTSELPN